MPTEQAQPKCTDIRIHRGGGGKVAIIDYGRVSSDYSVSISRAYAIPEGWTDEQVTDFEDRVLAEFKDRIDPILDAEFQERWNQKMWEGEE